MIVLEDLPQRWWLECRRMVIEPPAHLRIRAEPKVDARVIVAIERDALERIAVAMDHADGPNIDVFIDDVAIKRGEERR